MVEEKSIDLRFRMVSSFGCLLMVARHEYKRLHRASQLRILSPHETDFMSDYLLFVHKPSLLDRETFRHSVLSYFNIDI